MPASSPQKTDAFALDLGAVQAHLAEAGYALDAGAGARRLSGGLSNLNYLIRVDGRPTVLRRPPDGDLPVGAHDMAREHRVLSRLSKVFAPAPESFHFCADRSVIGVPFHLLEYREGTVFNGDRLPDGSGNAEATGKLASEMVSALVRLHGVDARAVGLGDLGKPEGFYERNATGWMRRAEALHPGDDVLVRVSQVGAWLLAHVPRPSAPALLHSDFKLDNCMFSPDLRITTILDWDMSTRGDPLMDLATLLSYWVQPGDPDCMFRLRQMPTVNHPFPPRGDIVEAYARTSRRDVGEFGSWRVLSLLKLGVVFIQLHRNWARGAMAGANYSDFAALGAEIVDFAAHETSAAF